MNQPTSVARNLHNLAQLLLANNRLVEADDVIRQAIVIDERTYGPQHTTYASSKLAHAVVLQALDQFDEAESAISLALRIFHHHYGSDHPNTQLAKENYEFLLHDMGKSVEEAKAKIESKIQEEFN